MRVFPVASVIAVLLSACSGTYTSQTSEVSRGTVASETQVLVTKDDLNELREESGRAETPQVQTTVPRSTNTTQTTVPRSAGNSNLPTRPSLMECADARSISSREGRRDVNETIDELYQELTCALNDVHNDIHQTSYENYVRSVERYEQSEKDRLEDQRRLSECERTGIPDYSGWIDPPEPVDGDEDPCIWLSLRLSSSEFHQRKPGSFDEHQAEPLTSFATFVQKWTELETLAEVYPDSFSPESLAVIVSQGGGWRKCLSDQVICIDFHG